MITAEELRSWSAVTATDPATVDAIDEAVASANAMIERRCISALPDPWPDEVHTAALIEAARTLKRRGSPEGVAGFGGDFGLVRVSGIDPTIEANLSPWLKVPFS
jgi:hypothetical protein